MVRLQGHLDVLEHGQRREGRGDLEGAAHSSAPDRVGREPGETLALEAHLARVRPELARQHVEQGGLAGAVGTDEGTDLAARHDQVHRGHGLDAAERLREPARLEHGRGHGPLQRSEPAMPRGKARTRRARIPPSTSCQ